jgi:hypothetical protein
MKRLLSPFIFAYQAVVDPKTNASVMNRLFWPLVIALVLLLGAQSIYVLFFSGPDHKWGHVSKGGVVWRDDVDYTSKIDVFTCDDRVYFFMAYAFDRGSSFDGGASSIEGATTGTMIIRPKGRGKDGVKDRALVWSCTTKDGKTGAVVIDGQKFDLARGAIFLVKAKDKETEAEQISVDMEKLKGEDDDRKIEAVGAAQPRIGAFLKEIRGEK